MGRLITIALRWRTSASAAVVAVVLLGACSASSTAPAISSAVAIDGSADHACIVTGRGDVRCWGDNRFGQLGDGTTTDPPAGSSVLARVSEVVDVVTGSEFTCALRRSGTLACWGFNLVGQLGDGAKDGISLLPVTVGRVTNVIDVAAGGDHACAVRSDGHVLCWGGNDFGQLGDGTRSGRVRPVAVLGIDDAVQVTAGTGFTCIRKRGGAVACWGLNSLGQLGDGHFDDSLSPSPVVGLGRAMTVDAGLDDACAVVVGAGVRCWGAGETLGEDRKAPGLGRPLRSLPDSSSAVGVAVGERSACVLEDGRASCWDTVTAERILRAPVRSGSNLVTIAISDLCTAPRGREMTCRRFR